MTCTTLSRFFLAAGVVALTHFPATASACSACMGDVNSNTAGATNAAIFLMLGFIGGVLALLVAFGVSLMKRANAPVATHHNLTPSTSDASANS
jgi:hypothetical protein